MEKKKNLINLIFSPKLLIIEWFFIVLFCVFIGFSVNVKAASNIVSALPFNPNLSEYGLNETDLNIIQGTLDAYNYNYNIYDMPCIIFKNVEGTWFNYSTWGDVPAYSVYFVSLDSNDYVPCTWSTGSNFENFVLRDSNYYLDANIGSYASVASFAIRRQDISSINGWYCSMSGPNPGVTIRLFGQYNPITVQCVNGESVTYVPYYPSYVSQPFFTSDSNYVTHSFLTNYSEPVAPSGHATAPDLTGDNIGSDKPDIDDYIPNIPSMPSLDNSSLEKIAESIFNILQWGFNAIKGTLNGLFEYLADTFTYSIQKVIDNIKNAIQNFYDNMVSLFEPLLNGLAEIAQGIKEAIENIGLLLEVFFAPFDETQFQEAYENCDFINAVDGVKDSIEEFEHAFTYAEERDYYTLYLGFIMDGYTVNYDLDFSWLYPLRQYYRPIIWAVVVYEFFVYLVSQLSDYLQGRSGK